MTPDQFFDELNKLFGTDDGYENHLKRIKELKEETEGIMNEEDTQHILGINAYEKFCQAMCELNFDEDMISEMKTDVTELKEKIAELEESEQSTRNYWQSKYEFEKDALSKIQGERDKYFRMLQTRKEENEKLQRVIDSVKAHLDDEEHVVISTPLKYAPIVNAIERLKKQNAELQTDLEDEKEEHANTEYDLEKLRESLEPLDEMMDKIKDVNEYEHVVDYVNGLHEKNIELKEASLIQFTRAQKYYESINELQEKYENEESTNKMLNEAIINHTEMLDELRTYLSNFDGDEVEVFDKIVKGSTD